MDKTKMPKVYVDEKQKEIITALLKKINRKKLVGLKTINEILKEEQMKLKELKSNE